jgi:arylsulfatase A-like enzyme
MLHSILNLLLPLAVLQLLVCQRSAGEALLVPWTVSLLCLTGWFALALSLGWRFRRIGPVFLYIFLALQYTGLLFGFVAGSPLDYSLVRHSLPELLDAASWAVILSAVNPTLLLGALLVFAHSLVLARRLTNQGPPLFLHTPGSRQIAAAGIGLSLMLANTVAHQVNQEVFYAFAKSALESFRFGQSLSAFSPTTPLRKWSSLPPPKSRALPHSPHVFLIFIESFNSNYLGSKTKTGVKITPFLDQLALESLVVENFYGNSIQTVRGEFHTLCGLPPVYRGLEFVSFPETQLRCLPKILQDHGYTTSFYQSYKNLSFNNVGNYLQKIGFSRVEGGVSTEFAERENPPQLRWGVQDDYLYRYMFSQLDRQQQTTPASARGPYFVSLLGAALHYPYRSKDQPTGRPFIQPTSIEEHYQNALWNTDRFLATFFSELRRRSYLRNSVVILVGDHGIPLGEHGKYIQGGGYFYEEYFRTPLLIWSPGRVPAARIQKTAYSQYDIAPTLLEILKFEETTQFEGSSFLQGTESSNAVLLANPKGKPYLGSVRYPFKYILDMASQQEFVFNLETDPGEKQNLARQLSVSPLLRPFRRDIARIKENQLRMENNLYWE